jgi:hypothetical protein
LNTKRTQAFEGYTTNLYILLLRDKKERKYIQIKWSVLKRKRVNESSIFKTYLMKVMRYILPYLDMIDIREDDRNYNYYHRIQEHEVKEVLKHMSNKNFILKPEPAPNLKFSPNPILLQEINIHHFLLIHSIWGRKIPNFIFASNRPLHKVISQFQTRVMITVIKCSKISQKSG